MLKYRIWGPIKLVGEMLSRPWQALRGKKKRRRLALPRHFREITQLRNGTFLIIMCRQTETKPLGFF